MTTSNIDCCPCLSLIEIQTHRHILLYKIDISRCAQEMFAPDICLPRDADFLFSIEFATSMLLISHMHMYQALHLLHHFKYLFCDTKHTACASLKHFTGHMYQSLHHLHPTCRMLHNPCIPVCQYSNHGIA